MGEHNESRGPLGLVLGAALFVGLLGAGATALSQAAAHGAGVLGTMSLARPTVVVLAMASAFFLAAGVLRLARWRIAGEPHSAFAGAALLVMGGLCLPLGGLALLFPSTDDLSLVGPATRTIAELVAVALLVRALTVVDMSRAELPSRLLPRLFLGLTLVFLVLLAAQQVAPHTMTGQALPGMVLATVRALAWFGVALYAATRAPELAWAGRVAPLLMGMGFAEALRGLDLARPGAWTFAALLVCVSMAALSTRAALLDLDDAVSADERGRTDLSQALTLVSQEAVGLSEWREQLTHDARNACAGLRAALSILERQDGRIDPATRERLRLAAAQELGHIEHLINRSADEPCAPFEVSEVVRRVAEAAWAVGARVSVQGLPVHALGRPGDLAAVLKNLLVNAQTHAPGSQVRFAVTSDEGIVTITCADDGPGLSPEEACRAFDRGFRGRASNGSGLGLHGARELMLEQGGDLVLDPTGTGATFVTTLPHVAVSTRPRQAVRVPTQRVHAAGPRIAREVPVA
ncbi:HAMP domain-containing sensor histidine kinase [Marmoricola sp. URHB0036]|uniref:sensor histidine kinase n=1 Tax=Marmoricola sp. URHB0036 TaxID=1298863 RepID=UPI001E49568E|nr:HAMP domain-containing sensor histidine kinase [Marmoricola sp. URHB0036]